LYYRYAGISLLLQPRGIIKPFIGSSPHLRDDG
jgi:hypothetical protein